MIAGLRLPPLVGFPGFKIIARSRLPGRGGEIALLIDQNWAYKILSLDESHGYQHLFFKIKSTRYTDIIIGVLY